jgi:16S rRNA processing protein RimM
VIGSSQSRERRDTPSIDESQLLEIGYLGKPHGLRGELRLALHNPDGDALDCVERLVVRLRGEFETLQLEAIRGGSSPAIVAFTGVESRNDAERLKGATVFVYRAELPPLEPGEYYLSDLVGATVVGPNGDVGQVVELALYPTVDSLVIRGVTGQRLEQPLVEPWLESVDAAAKVIRLRSLDGLIE